MTWIRHSHLIRTFILPALSIRVFKSKEFRIFDIAGDPEKDSAETRQTWMSSLAEGAKPWPHHGYLREWMQFLKTPEELKL